MLAVDIRETVMLYAEIAAGNDDVYTARWGGGLSVRSVDGR